eukprot:9668233-Alexandrium_andersonii.AAC.1
MGPPALMLRQASFVPPTGSRRGPVGLTVGPLIGTAREPRDPFEQLLKWMPIRRIYSGVSGRPFEIEPEMMCFEMARPGNATKKKGVVSEVLRP